MVKFIGYYMFATHVWKDSSSSPTVINLREMSHIDEMCDDDLGTHVVIFLKDGNAVPIEGNIIDVLAEFQKHLSTMY